MLNGNKIKKNRCSRLNLGAWRKFVCVCAFDVRHESDERHIEFGQWRVPQKLGPSAWWCLRRESWCKIHDQFMYCIKRRQCIIICPFSGVRVLAYDSGTFLFCIMYCSGPSEHLLLSKGRQNNSMQPVISSPPSSILLLGDVRSPISYRTKKSKENAVQPWQLQHSIHMCKIIIVCCSFILCLIVFFVIFVVSWTNTCVSWTPDGSGS